MVRLTRVRKILKGINFKQYLVRKQNDLVCGLLIKRFYTPLREDNLIRLGSSYGGWWVPKFSKENLPAGAILVSAGLGGDVSFDKEMLHRGFVCIGLDPLVEAITYSKTELGMFEHFIPVNAGLSDSHGKKLFYAPQVKEHDSWSVNNMHGTDLLHAKQFDVLSLKDLEEIFPPLKHSTFRILKLDIEGGEIPIIRQIILLNIKFDFLAIEIDFLSLIPFLSLNKRIRHLFIVWNLMHGLEKMGYSLCKMENFNFCWTLRNGTIKSSGELNAKS